MGVATSTAAGRSRLSARVWAGKMVESVTMDNITYCNPTRVVFGPGVVEQVGAEVAAVGSRALLVSGRSSAERSGLLARTVDLLDQAGVTVSHLRGVAPNPRLSSLEQGIELCRSRGIDVVVGLGGGSCLDCAKAIAGGALYPGDPWDMVRHGQSPYVPPTEALPTVMVPTLAAAGSEMNCNAVITNEETEEKCFTSGQACLYPRVCVVDPELTRTVPADQTAYGAVDTIAHVLEAYLNGPDGAPLQDRLQESVMLTVIEYAPRAITDPDDVDARTQLQWASIVAQNGWTHAGSRGNFAMHQIEHAVSAHYDIAHGAGLAIVMPAWMKIACDSRLEKYVQFAQRVFGIRVEGREPNAVARDGLRAFEDYLRGLDVPVRLGEAGIGRERFERLRDDILRISGNEQGLLPGRPPLDGEGIMDVLELAV